MIRMDIPGSWVTPHTGSSVWRKSHHSIEAQVEELEAFETPFHPPALTLSNQNGKSNQRPYYILGTNMENSASPKNLRMQEWLFLSCLLLSSSFGFCVSWGQLENDCTLQQVQPSSSSNCSCRARGGMLLGQIWKASCTGYVVTNLENILIFKQSEKKIIPMEQTTIIFILLLQSYVNTSCPLW